MLSIEEFIIIVFCYVDDYFQSISHNVKVRERGFSPALCDSEVITMEIVAEFLGIDTDKGTWEYFVSHWRHLFPNIKSRTTFTRQAANLWYWKQKLQKKFSLELGAYDDNIHIVDGFPIPICHFSRAFFSKLFSGSAAYGYCAAKDEKFYGFRGHLLISFDGVITSFTVTAANVDERDALWELLPGIEGLVIGDKGYLKEELREQLLQLGIDLQTPFRSNMKDSRDPVSVKKFTKRRRLIETVIGQLCERFNIEKVRARDIWHLTVRITRKCLSHTVASFINRLYGRDPLNFDGLVSV
jgi:IS5 family transposase